MNNTLRGIHFGSYWMGANDIVWLMAKELSKLCRLYIVDTDIYSNPGGEKVYAEKKAENAVYPVRWLDDSIVMSYVKRVKPDFIVVNAGSMSITPRMSKMLDDQGIVRVGISLSDPDVFFDNGRIYAGLYDLFYTNSLYAYNHLYNRSTTHINLLPFAASPAFHRPLRTIPKLYDIVVVGGARPERVSLVNTLRSYFSVGTYGSGWLEGGGEVHGLSQVKAINSGRLYLSFSQTYAGYENVKVGLFEATACKSLVLTHFTHELESYFTPGIDLIGYQSTKELPWIIDDLLHDSTRAEWIATNGYGRTLTEHTWENRWTQVLTDIRKVQNE